MKPPARKRQTPAEAAASRQAASTSTETPSVKKATKKTNAPKKQAASKTNAKPKKSTAPKKQSPPKRKQAANATSAQESPTKKKRTGLKGSVNTSAPLGVVDPESKIVGSIVLSPEDDAPLDAMLVLVNPSANMDKYFVLQVIERQDEADPQCGQFTVYSRWGRTGTAGTALEKTFQDVSEAIEHFEEKFLEKTSVRWELRTLPAVPEKYKFIVQDFSAKQAGYNGIWQYYVDDGVDGKADGWYNYDVPASCIVDQLYSECQSNPTLGLQSRVVSSGAYLYNVDMQSMTQMNLTTHKIRQICRAGSCAGLHIAPPPTTIVATVSVPPVARPVIVQPGLLFGKATKPGVNASQPKLGHAVAPPPPASVQQATEPAEQEASSEIPVDTEIMNKGYTPEDYSVVDDFNAVLNQCNITASNNNNKYYRIQLLKENNGDFHVWTRWGRVGESSSQAALLGPFLDKEAAAVTFGKKYKDKTGNKWEDRENFKPKKGKYEPVLVVNDVPGEAIINGSIKKEPNVEFLPCTLDSKTKELIEVIHSKDMLNDALKNFNIDVTRMPLGALDAKQILRGVAVLDEIKAALANPEGIDFSELSSKFYTAIPHSFGRTRPPVIDTPDSLQSCYDRCDILTDIASTNSKLEENEKKQAKTEKKMVPHPADQHYLSLGASLSLVDRSSEEFSVIKTYFEQTKARDYGSWNLLDVWKVDRNGEGSRFKSYDHLEGRKLLFHGTGMEVVAAILNSGLRIMPHSGGRVGKGIYLANAQQKSAGYTRAWGVRFACMFLAEAALGVPKEITDDQPYLTKAPTGYNSVLARGTLAPAEYKNVKIEEKSVAVPQGPPVDSGIESSFADDEYLVYDEAQVRLRYILTTTM